MTQLSPKRSSAFANGIVEDSVLLPPAAGVAWVRGVNTAEWS